MFVLSSAFKAARHQPLSATGEALKQSMNTTAAIYLLGENLKLPTTTPKLQAQLFEELPSCHPLLQALC